MLSIGREVETPEALATRLTESPTLPVLAGPLDTVTRTLITVPNRLIGLSWGFDLPALQRADDLAWLTQLDGLIIDSVANVELAHSAGVAPELVTLLPWGIDLDDFRIDGPRISPEDLHLDSDARIVLSLRAHEARYHVADIVDAWARIAQSAPDSALVIGHHGSLTAAIQDQVTALGLTDRVRFIGTVPERELAPLLRAAACYVSASEIDGTSVTLLQAMACGTPVVVSGTPGNLGWVQAGLTGRLFPVGDVQELTTQLQSSLNADNAGLVARAHTRVLSDADWHANIQRLEGALFPSTA